MTDRSPRTRPDRREPVRNLSRRGFLGAASGALVLGVGLRLAPAAAQTRAEGPAAVAPKPGTRVAAFLEIRPDDSDVQRQETDRDAVQVMTIHRAKGLEAWVVFLACATFTDNHNRPTQLYHDEARRLVRVKLGRAGGKGKKDGSLHQAAPVWLLRTLLQAMQQRLNLDTALVDDVVLGCVTPVGEQGADIARTAVLDAEWAQTVAGVTPASAARSSPRAPTTR